MMHLHRVVRYGACAFAASILLSACGNHAPPQNEPPPPPPAQVEGIATPSSVAVVTATHAE
jgi:hypothetical protein